MTFQASDSKGNQFLDLLDDDYNPIEPSYIKGGPWLQSFSHSNSFYARATRAITNYVPIGEYRLRFLPNMNFLCPCNNYPIESRRHILHECKRFNGYWNLRRDSLSYFIMFLITNPNAFIFINSQFIYLSRSQSFLFSHFLCQLVLISCFFSFSFLFFFPFSLIFLLVCLLYIQL